MLMHVALASLQDYVVDKWDEVSVSDEFEQCCQEVASGEYVIHVELCDSCSSNVCRWGPEGGKTLMALFRRLRSPNAMGYTRN